MDVGRGADPVEMMMLQVGQPARDPRDVVVVDQGDDSHRLALVVGDRLLDQGGAHQATHRFAPVGIAVHLAVLVEHPEQISPDRDAESDQGIFHGCAPGLAPPASAVGVADYTEATETHAPSCFALATAASTNAMPATPSAMPGCANGLGAFSPRRPRIVHSSVRCRLARAS